MPHDLKIVKIPVIKEIRSQDLLNPSNIKGYDPCPILKKERREKFVVIHLNSFESFIHISTRPGINSLLLELGNIFVDEDEVLVVDKEGSGIAGVAYLKNNTTLLLKHRHDSKELSVGFKDIKSISKIKASMMNPFL